MNKRRMLINKITKTAIFAALSIILYFLKFNMPVLFPEFLEFNFSMIPALIAAFVLGPIEGGVVILIRYLFKLPFTSTATVGELADLIIGLATVVPSGFLYKRFRSKKGGVFALGLAFVMWVTFGVLSNWLITIPFYIQFFFHGKIEVLAKICSVAIPSITAENFMGKYLLFAALPFNAMLAFFVCVVTFFVYKNISVIFKHDFFNKKEKNKLPKIMVMMDSFKGTMTSKQVGTIVATELKKRSYTVEQFPISDGGEGFLDVIRKLKHCEDKRDECEVHDALGRIHFASYVWNSKEKTAYLELAECCGIYQLKVNELNPYTSSSYGLGEQIKYVVEKHHPQKIVIGLGGSASCDAGSGMLEALGTLFYDENNTLLTSMNNEKLGKVTKIHVGVARALLLGIEVSVLTDVVNPLLGKDGAVYVFGKQKGAKEEDLPLLEANIQHFAQVFEQQVFGNKSKDETGEGAAGGVGYAFHRVIQAKILEGSSTILNWFNFEQICKKYDVIITGEGKLDHQTLQGKVIQGMLQYHPKRLVILTGITEISTNQAEVYAIVPQICSLEESLKQPEKALIQLIQQIQI